MTVADSSDESYVRRAMVLAERAAVNGDVPIGAILTCDDTVFEAFNEKERRPDPTAHAEILALQGAARALERWRFTDATLYVTKEPCVMCAGAMIAARIKRLVYGCADPKGGAAGSVIDIFTLAQVNHRVEVIGGVLADTTAAQLQAFFAAKRGNV